MARIMKRDARRVALHCDGRPWVAALLLLSLLLGATTTASAETVVKFNGVGSLVETKPTIDFSAGVFSASVWVWPQRKTTENEAVVSFAQSDLKVAATIGWSNGTFYYSDESKGKVSAASSYARKEWHYVTLTTEVADNGVYLDASSNKVAHRKVVLYVDGEKALEFTTMLPDLSTAVVTAGFEYSHSKKQSHFSGLMDEVRAYASTLTGTEAVDLPFTRPPTGTKVYLSFEALKDLDLSASTQEIDGVTYGFVETVAVDRMPYDPLSLGTVTKTSPFSNSLYTSYQGPMSGLTLTVNGVNFANTNFLKVTMDGAVLGHTYSSADKLFVSLPALGIAQAGKKKVKVTNGGTNSGEFDFTYAYSVVEDLNANLVAHYNFDGHLETVDRTLSAKDATHVNTYQGTASFTADRNAKINRALQFTYGQKLEAPVAVGSKSASSVCAWFYAEPGNHTLYGEKGHSASKRYNEVSIGSDGVISFGGASSGAAIIFDAWQFVCATRSGTKGAVYSAGRMVAEVDLSAPGEALTAALIAAHLKGKVDDVWLWERQVAADEIKQLYEEEEYAIELDGSHHFTLTNGADKFDSALWHTNSEVTAEVWIKPEAVSGTSRLLYQPSKKEGATGDAALGFSVSLVDGKVEFRVMLDSGLTPPIFRSIATSSVVITTGSWQLVSVTYDQSSMMIAVNGVAQSVGVSSFLSGSLTVTEPYVTKYTFLTIVSDPTSLDKQPIEDSTKTIIVGESFKGLVGDVRLWSDDLTEAQVLTYYQCKPSVKSHASLYAYFAFDQGAGKTYASGSASSLVLTFSGTNDPFWVFSDHGRPAAAISWPQSPVTGGGTVSGKAGEAATFTFQAKDKCGNVLKTGGDAVQVVMAGPLDTHLNLFYGAAADNGDGTYSGSYQANLCGFYALRVEDESVPVTDGTYLNGTFATKLAQNTPVKVFVDSAATNASVSYVYDDADLQASDDRKTVVAGATTKFTLQAMDEFGCVKAKGGDLFRVALSGTYDHEGRVVDLGNGKYTVEYSPLMAGKTLLSVTLDGLHVGTKAKQDVQAENLSRFFGYDGAGSPFCIDASTGSSLEFDGSNFVEVADSPALDLSDKYTVDFFVKPKQAALTAKLLSKESPISGRGYYVSLSSGLVSTGVYVGAEQYRYIETSYAPLVDSWTHLAVTYSGSQLTIYADGKEIAKELYEEERAPRGNSQKLIIGNGLVGLLDEVRVSSEALTKAAIASTMHCPSLSDSVEAYYRFNDKVGTAATDYSDNKADGVLKGTPLPTFSTDEAPTNAGVLDLAASTFEGKGLTSAVVGETAAFTAKLVDKCGFPYNSVLENNAVPSSLMQAGFENISQSDYVTPVNNAETFPVASITANSLSCVGTNLFEVKYTPSSCGFANLKMKVEGQDLSPYQVSFHTNNVTDPAKTIVSVSSQVVSGVGFEIKITTFDTFGCGRISGGDAIDLALTRVSKPASEGTLHGPDTVVTKITASDNGDGTYTAKAVAPSPGTYLLDVAVGEVRTSASPVTITARPPSFRKVLTDGPGELYKSMVTSYKGDVYVINGWAPNKEFVDSVWRYEPGSDASTWSFRKKITLTSVPTHAVSFVVNTKALVDLGKVNADCSDILFKSATTGASISYWIDPLPGCNALETTFWLNPGEKEIYMYYGNTHAAASALASAESLMVVYDDFESGATFGDHGYNLTSPCGSCFIPTDQDPSAFTITEETAVSGKSSLKVNSLSTTGGAIEKAVTPMTSYVLKGHFYVFGSDAHETTTAVNWFSPNYAPCTDASSSGNVMCSQGFILGVNSQVSRTHFTSSYPWQATTVPRRDGWHSFEIVDDGTTATFAFDGVVAPALTRPSKKLDRVLLYAGGGSVGAWDAIYVARYTPGIHYATGTEEGVVMNGKSFFSVTTRGSRPPSRRSTTFAMDAEKMYLIGGFGRYGSTGALPSYGAIGSHAAEDKVWYLNLNKMRWHHVVPYGSLRPSPREDHATALYQDKVYVFGGRSGENFLNDTFVYDISENAYSRVAASGPSGRFGHAAAVYGASMFVFGGYTAEGPTNEMWRFDFDSMTWHEVTPEGSPSGRFMFASAVSGPSWFVTGGHTLSGGLGSAVHRYDFDYNIWVDVSVDGAPQQVASASAVFPDAAAGKMYLYGGKTQDAYSSDFLQLSL